MSNVLEPGTPTATAEPSANRYTPDALERMARIRAMADEFPDEPNPQPLTPADIRIARQTSAEALEKTAVFIEASPRLGGAVADSTVLRDAIAFELAYGGVRDEARALARRVDLAIMRRKLKATKTARGLYRVAKPFATLAVGDSVRTHVADIQRTLVPQRRVRKGAAPAPAAPPADAEASARK